jgi:ATP-binding cassette subfamily F protein 3
MTNLTELDRRQIAPSADGQPTVNRQSKPGSNQSGALDYAAQKAAAAEKRKKEKQIAEVENEIAALEGKQAEMEQLLAMPENQTQENFQKYETIKHQIEQKMYEWEILSEN